MSEGELEEHRAKRLVMERPDAVQRLLDHADHPVVLVQAPAGYGKSTLVSQWATADQRRFVWARPGDLNGDPSSLVHHLTSVLRAGNGRPGVLEDAGTDSDRLGSIDALIRLLGTCAPVVLVFDDVDRCSPSELSQVVEQLIPNVPPRSQVVLVGRRCPDVALTRPRMDGEVYVLRTHDLALSAEQATEMVRRSGAASDPCEEQELVRRADGWAAGVALLVQDGREGELASEYLENEILGPLPEESVRFLERTSVLDVVSPRTADELLRTDDSALTLDALRADDCVLLVPLPDEGPGHFRHHRLFAPLLQSRLEHRDPGEARELHRRAGEICGRRGDTAGAVTHAIASDDETHAADLILAATPALVFGGRVEHLHGLLDQLGENAVERLPAAAVATAWCGLGCGDAQMLGRASRAATSFAEIGPLADGSTTVATAMAMLRAMAAPQGVPGVLRDSEVVRRAGGVDANPWWGLATFMQGTAHSMLGNDAEARSRFSEAYSLLGDLPLFDAGTFSHLALLDLRAGDVSSAEVNAARGLEIASRHHLESLAPAVAVYAIGAMMEARAGRFDSARAAAAVADDVLENFDPLGPRTALMCRICLIDTALSLDDRSTARTQAHRAESVRRREPTAIRLNHDLDALLAQLDAGERLDRSESDRLSPAEIKVLALLPTHLSLTEIGEQLFISHNTAKSHSVAIYRKLGVSKRSEAVRTARDLGLLAETPSFT